jgi:hypothetical protein
MAETSAPVQETSNSNTCSLCHAETAQGQVQNINGHPVCSSCFAQIQNEIAAQAITARALPLALIGGGLGALLAAVIWTAIGVSTGYEVGYVAVLVGFLAGKGVVLFNGPQRGRPLQLAAVIASLAGLVLAKIAIVDYYLVQEAIKQGTSVSYLSPGVIIGSIIVLPRVFSLFDILWVYLALQVAWQIPKATTLTTAK